MPARVLVVDPGVEDALHLRRLQTRCLGHGRGIRGCVDLTALVLVRHGDLDCRELRGPDPLGQRHARSSVRDFPRAGDADDDAAGIEHDELRRTGRGRRGRHRPDSAAARESRSDHPEQRREHRVDQQDRGDREEHGAHEERHQPGRHHRGRRRIARRIRPRCRARAQTAAATEDHAREDGAARVTPRPPNARGGRQDGGLATSDGTPGAGRAGLDRPATSCAVRTNASTAGDDRETDHTTRIGATASASVSGR